MATKKTAKKDLSPKTSKVKGGGFAINENVTLLRGAKRASQD